MSVTYAKGFEAAGVSAGISAHEGKKDLALVVNQGPLHSAAGVFTSNRFCAAPVQWSRKAVADGSLHAVVINSGGANACTGEAGYLQSAKTAGAAATQLGLAPQEVAVASTGLIGELLPMDNVLQGVEHAFSHLADTENAGSDAS
ncbi:MAG: bifunctional ornithine acetyltransferase/N-acetylglutamate synthase, partial [Bifidobacterium crudilactis]|nr:bifunctional ornithine acetyltransferase/N-acetylglutamate synthase [Bifidobacterium crudilactis]